MYDDKIKNLYNILSDNYLINDEIINHNTKIILDYYNKFNSIYNSSILYKKQFILINIYLNVQCMK